MYDYLNGDLLGEKMTHWPYYDEVFYVFETAAIDALNDKYKQTHRKRLNINNDTTDIVALLTHAEIYNGLGYYNNNKINPYLYSRTNIYEKGKFVEVDGASVYKPDLIDKQIGAYVLLSALLNR